jgi:hypothetical protein
MNVNIAKRDSLSVLFDAVAADKSTYADEIVDQRERLPFTDLSDLKRRCPKAVSKIPDELLSSLFY